MTFPWHRALRCTASAAALALMCFSLTGCGDNKTETPTQPEPPQAKVTLKIEARPESSGEQTRIHKIDELGRELEVEIAFRDKTKGWEIYNPDSGALVEVKRTHTNHKVLQLHIKYKGGKIVWEERYYPNGKLQQSRVWHKNGDRELRQYVNDGTTELTRLLIRQDGSGQWIQYRQDWQSRTVKGIAQSFTWTANGDSTREMYNQADGTTLISRSEKNGDNLVVSGLRADGTLLYKQYHKSSGDEQSRRNSFLPPWILQKVELYSADGKTIEREFHYDGSLPYPYCPSSVHFPMPGGGKRVVECTPNPQTSEAEVTGEKIFDASGNLVSEQTGQTGASLADLKPEHTWVQVEHGMPVNLKTHTEQWFRQ